MMYVKRVVLPCLFFPADAHHADVYPGSRQPPLRHGSLGAAGDWYRFAWVENSL